MSTTQSPPQRRTYKDFLQACVRDFARAETAARDLHLLANLDDDARDELDKLAGMLNKWKKDCAFAVGLSRL
jgi:hypothetical protein